MKNKTQEVLFLLKWSKLTSLNDMYVRTSTGIALSTPARNFKESARKQVRAQLPKILPFNNKDKFELKLHFALNTRFFVRDVSNFTKLIEDAIFDELDINDARNIILVLSKSYKKKLKNEYIVGSVRKLSEDEYSKIAEDSINYDDIIISSSGNISVSDKYLLSKNIDSKTLDMDEKIFSLSEVHELLSKQFIKMMEIGMDDDLSSMTLNKGINPIK